jgi:hypothetical protein
MIILSAQKFHKYTFSQSQGKDRFITALEENN